MSRALVAAAASSLQPCTGPAASALNMSLVALALDMSLVALALNMSLAMPPLLRLPPGCTPSLVSC
jgi:hypothetical protein